MATSFTVSCKYNFMGIIKNRRSNFHAFEYRKEKTDIKEKIAKQALSPVGNTEEAVFCSEDFFPA